MFVFELPETLCSPRLLPAILASAVYLLVLAAIWVAVRTMESHLLMSV